MHPAHWCFHHELRPVGSEPARHDGYPTAEQLRIAHRRDKLRCLQLLARFGLDIPRTIMTHRRDEVPTAIRRIGGLPVIVKLTRGTRGVGVMIANTLEEIEGILDTMKDLGQEILLQEFIKESKGRDVRALVIGDRAVAAMRRQARAGEFRSNLHRGGEGKPIELPKRYAEIAVKAARVMGLELAGVDMLETRAGPKIMEVNSSPGFEGLEKATGMDIAGLIIDHAIQFAGARATGWSRQRLIWVKVRMSVVRIEDARSSNYKAIAFLVLAFVAMPTVVLVTVGIFVLVLGKAKKDYVFGSLIVGLSLTMIAGISAPPPPMASSGAERLLSKLQTEFVNKVSHDLRTPLTSIRMFVDTLQMGRIHDAGRVQQCLDVP